MRILLLTGSPAHYMAPPQLGDTQIVAGPDWPDAQSPKGDWISIKTPVGDYNLVTLLDKLAADQQPDAVVSLVDASWRNTPRNLAAFRGPKALLVADTHHLSSPLIGMLKYAASEPYDRIVFLYDRHHLSFFQSAGFNNLYWFPGLTFPHDDETVKAARMKNLDPRIAFVGQSGKFHPRRARLLDALKKSKLPLDQQRLSQRKALKFYGSSAIGLNASLNGDLNLRVFEIIASGAALLTDRLAPESGLFRLFTEGKDIFTYGNEDELTERAKYSLIHPRETAEVGLAGSALFDRLFNAPLRRAAFLDLLVDGKHVQAFAESANVTQRVYFGGNTDQLLQSIIAYEKIQEVHRVQEQVNVVVSPDAPACTSDIFKTLPRATLSNSSATNRADLAVYSTSSLGAAAASGAARLWCWDATQIEMIKLTDYLLSYNYRLESNDIALYCNSTQPITQKCVLKLGEKARINFEKGDINGALNQSGSALKQDGICLEAITVLADVALVKHSGAPAKKLLRQAPILAPEDGAAIPAGALQPPRDRAIDPPLDQILMKNHTDCRGVDSVSDLVNRASRALKNADHAMAAGFIQTALTRDSRHTEALVVAARLALATNDSDMARGALDILQATAPDDERLHALALEFALRVEVVSPALPILRQARQALATGAPPEEDIRQARLLHHQGRHEQAQAVCRRVLESIPNHVPILCLLGDSLVACGNEPQALAYYERAMKLNPGHALAGTRAASLRFRKIWGPAPTPRPRIHHAPCLQMSTLGANGRFGNQLFQYAFARRYAETHGLELTVSDWVGRDLFELDDALPDSSLPPVGENTLQPDVFTLMADPEPSPQLMDRDLNGYFVPHTSKWAPHKDAFRRWFQPGTRIKSGLDGIVARLRANGRTLVALHLRRGDFGYGDFWVAPNSWYLRALETLWPTLDQPVLYIATDDPAARKAFDRFNPIEADPQGFNLAGANYFIDHYILSKADLLMISNSTFSFTAAMLNQHSQATYRPDPATQSMTAFSPWEAQVSLSAKETVEPVLPVQQKFIEQLVQAQDTVMHYGRFCAPWTNAVRATRPALRVIELEAGEQLDAARTQLGLRHIQHVAVDDTVHLPAFLAGAAKTLHLARIDFVHVTVRPSSANLEALMQIRAAGFRLFGLADSGVYPFQLGPVGVVTGVLAINERIVPFMLKQESKEMIDIAQQCAKNSITPRGVIHVGAHEGKEVGSYEDMGSPHVFYIEANPAVYDRLHANIEARDNKRAKISMLNRAVSDVPGTLELHLASFDQSSSLLPMRLHREIYPQVQPSGTISVQASRLDDVMLEQGLALTDFNILNIDVQGAEAMVLRGAPEVLRHVEAVNVEINFAELYQGCAMIEDVEDIMQAAGFRRVALSCPYHPTWGDALYVKQRTT